MFYDIFLDGRLVWNIPLLLGLLSIIILYGFLFKRIMNMGIFHKQPLLFFVGIVFLFMILGSPISAFSHLSFSLHMIQMSILYFIIPPMLLYGISKQMYEELIQKTQLQSFKKLLISPMKALLIFALLFFLYHLSSVLSILSQSSMLQNGYLFVLFLLSFRIWWPIVGPDESGRYEVNRKKRYIFLNGMLLLPACLLFIVTAFFEGTSNPFLIELTAELCLPDQASDFSLLPYPFNTKADQVMAGFFMLGLHKLALIFTKRLNFDS